MKLDISSKLVWSDIDGLEYSDEQLKKIMLKYVNQGGKVYVGTDSQLFPNKCNFVTVIAFHDIDQRVARYFFKKFKVDATKFNNLSAKILKEVELAIQTAQIVNDMCKEAEIELHIDIGTTEKNKTSQFFKMISGWVTSTGYDLRVKPRSWASSLADTHTKSKKIKSKRQL